MKYIIIIQLYLIYSLILFIKKEKIKSEHAKQILVKRLITTNNNTKELIRSFETLPTQCNEEIKVIIKHFNK